MSSSGASSAKGSKRHKDAIITEPFGKTNSADVAAKIGPASVCNDSLSSTEQPQRARRSSGALLAVQKLKEQEEEKKIAAVRSKLLGYDGHCWCCLQARTSQGQSTARKRSRSSQT